MSSIPRFSGEAIRDKLVHESGRIASEIGFLHFDRKKVSRVDESQARDRLTTTISNCVN
jgi:hypothetical protein